MSSGRECIKNTVALIFWLIDSSSSDLEVLELKKNASLDPGRCRTSLAALF